jgi:hypothetical protein
MSLPIALAAETHLAEGLALKLWLTINVEQSVIILIGVRTLTKYNTEEQIILLLNTLIRKKKCWKIQSS